MIEYLKNAHKILVFTGAGISTGSGIPDFRGPQGVWKRRQPVYYDEFLASDEKRVEYWDYKLEAWTDFAQAVPNATHYACFELEQMARLCAIVTQNIDGLHQAAGSSRVIEVHGTNRWIECVKCEARSEPGPHMEEFRRTRRPPICECGGFLKSATISFGQPLDPRVTRKAFDAAHECDLVIALGSTLSVQPAALVPLEAAQRGVPYIVINRGETDHDELCTLRLEGDVAEIFPPAVKELR
jgi:NAD-dependent protein deacetylase/lipoamidase